MEESTNQREEKTVCSREELQQANETLQSEIADLSSALLARDLEIQRLRERCEFLTTAVEQQDAVIAEIYATNTPINPVDGGLCTDKCSSTFKRLCGSIKTYTSLMGSVDSGRRMSVDNIERHSQNCHDKRPTPGEKHCEDVVKVDLDQLSYPARSSPQLKDHLSACASVYSSSSTATASSSSSLFGDVGELPQRSQSRTRTSPRKIPILQQHPAQAQDSISPTHDLFARSAGFLRKSSRTMSKRLSVSDLGLLSDNDDIIASGEQSLKAPQETDNDNQDESPGLKRATVSSKSHSQRHLFADVDEESHKNQTNQNKVNTRSHEKGKKKIESDSLTYSEFLQRISLPASRDILDKIRTFIGSILGPRGDGRPPRSTDYVEYAFYGTHEFRRRCQHFFKHMDDLLLHHPAWCHGSETKLATARDGIEKYVMDKVAEIAFNQLQECRQWIQQDEALLRRMQLLSFITPAMLDIKPCIRNEVVWSMASDELRRINSYRSPGDKINCIVRCCNVIFSVLNLSRGDFDSRPGADDFLPVFIYIVLHAQIPRLVSNCEYIAAYRNQSDLMSKAGYCFVNLRSAIEFIMVVDGSMLSISEDEFHRLYTESEKSRVKS